MKTSFSTCIKILVLSFLMIAVQNSFAAIYDINNVINGAQEVPPVVTPGSGTTVATYDDVTNLISYTVTFSGLIGTTTAGHFHGPAAPGVGAGVQIGYPNIPLGVTSGSFSNTATLTAVQETQLLGGLWYSNIHTSFRPGGEIRGQLYPTLRILNLTYLIEGLYDSGSNLMDTDTATVNLRNSTTPFAVVDNGVRNLSSAGTAAYSFGTAVNTTTYYIQMLHRNGLETWNASPVAFTNDTMAYDFTTSDTQAFGSNLKLKGTRYCAFSGDPNADGAIDVGDVVMIYNDASNFVSGYVPTDLTGDDFVDTSDLLIAYNNASNFVSVIRP